MRGRVEAVATMYYIARSLRIMTQPATPIEKSIGHGSSRFNSFAVSLYNI